LSAEETKIFLTKSLSASSRNEEANTGKNRMAVTSIKDICGDRRQDESPFKSWRGSLVQHTSRPNTIIDTDLIPCIAPYTIPS